MNNTAPIWMGVAAIAGLVFIIGTGVAFVMYDFPVTASVFVGALAASVAAVALFIGWAPPIAPTTDQHVAPADDLAPPPVSSANPTPASVTPVTTMTAAPATAAPVMTETTPPLTTPLTGSAARRPEGLAMARAEGADDLKLIRGVGPKLEQSLHDIGIYHFDQIAALSPAEQAWIDDNVDGVRGRATREDWVSQAKTLVANLKA